MPPDTRILLEHIRDSIGYIVDDTAGMTFPEFEQDRRTRQLVERNLEIIGEAVNRLSRVDPKTVGQISEYVQIIGVRNVLIHGYAIINHRTVWMAVQESLPVLRNEVENLLREAASE